jgi:hypothetical protein
MKYQAGFDMVRCDLKLTNEYDFKEIESGILIPTVPLKIHRQGMNRSIVTEAIIDTGYERGLLLSTDIRDLLFVIGDPDRQDSLSSGNIEIPCDVFLVRIKIFDIIGTELLKLVNICIRGPENKTYIADLLST